MAGCRKRFLGSCFGCLAGATFLFGLEANFGIFAKHSITHIKNPRDDCACPSGSVDREDPDATSAYQTG